MGLSARAATKGVARRWRRALQVTAPFLDSTEHTKAVRPERDHRNTEGRGEYFLGHVGSLKLPADYC
jgi:hypothetical protein